MKTERYQLAFMSLTCASALMAGNIAIENPQVISGTVSFEGLQGDHALISQQSDKAIVDYSQFDVLAGGSVHFDQPSAQAAILNRIHSATPSTLNGTITATGQLYFVNPAGVSFGPNSVVRADTFVAVAGQILNEDFLAGQLNFDLSGQVSNYGLIETLNDTVLMGDQVLNAGDIISLSGVSILAAGDKVLLRSNGSSLAVELTANAADAAQQPGVAIDNQGSVSGDEVLFSAGDAYSVALSNSGSVSAKKSAKLYSDGGAIEVSGDVSAQSSEGAGLIEIGGTDMGAGAPVASTVTIAESATIDASATAEGDGGHIVIFSAGETTMLGSVDARGAGEGSGGFAEVSGSQLELGDGLWDIQVGQGGSVLFDPTDVVVGPTEALNIANFLSLGTDVTVTTAIGGTDAGNITVNNQIVAAPGVGVTAGDFTLFADSSIEINALIDTFSGSLFMTAGDGITLNQQIAAGLLGSGANIELNAGGTFTVQGIAGISIFDDANLKIVANQFVNTVGANAILLSGTGFWQINLPTWTGNTYGGLASNNKAQFGSTGTAVTAITQNEYHFAAAPAIGITVNNDSKTYGDSPASATYQGYTVDASTFIDASTYGSVWTQDTAANTIIETGIAYSTTGSPTTADAGVYTDLTVTGLTSTNGYTYDITDGTFTVNTRALTVTANDRSRIYGNTLDLGTTEFTYVDTHDGDGVLPNGEVLTGVVLGSATAIDSTTTANVGVYTDEVTVGTLSGTGGFDPANYNVTAVAGDLEVTTRAVTVTANQQNKYYGESVSLDGTVFSVTDLNGGSALPHGETIDSTTMIYAFGPDLGANTLSVAATTNEVIEITAVSGSNGFDVNNYDFTFMKGDFVVDPRPITLSALQQSKQYGDTLTLDGTQFAVDDTLTMGSILPNGELIDSVTLNSQTGVDASTTANAGLYVGEIEITALDTTSNGFNPDNYDISYVQGNLLIDPRDITLSANNQARIYGDSMTLDNTEFTLLDKDGDALLPNGELVNTVDLSSVSDLATTTTTDAGTYIDNLVIGGQSGSNGFAASNYNITYVAGDLIINRRPITLTALEQEKFYGNSETLDGTVFAVTDYDLDALLPHGESVDLTTMTYAFGPDLGADTTTPVSTTGGVIQITGIAGSSNGFKESNYLVSYVNGTYTVNPRPITLTALEQSKQYGDVLVLDNTEFTLTDTLTGGNALPNSETITTVNLNSVTGVDASTTANAAIYTSEIEITGPDTVGGIFDVTNYDITYVAADLVVIPRDITVTASEQTRIYGESFTLDDTAFTVLDKDGDALLPNGELIDTVALNSAGGIAENTASSVGVYVDNLSISGQNGSNGFLASNYNITYVEGDFVITARPITLSADAQEKIYGDVITLDNTAFTLVDYDGDAVLPNGEQIDTVDLLSATGNGPTAAVALYTDDLSITGQTGSGGFDPSNYDISYVDGDFTVNVRAITVDLGDQSKFFGEPYDLDPTAFTVTDGPTGGSTLPNGELIDEVTFADVTTVPRRRSLPGLYLDALIASGVIGSNGFDVSNYDITFLTGNLTVNNFPAPTVKPGEILAEFTDYLYSGPPSSFLVGTTPPMSGNALNAYQTSGEWAKLSREQQLQVLAQLGQLSGGEELSEELLEYLLASTPAQ